MKAKIIMTLLIALCTFSQSANAAFILNGTRYIYDEGTNNIPIEINNISKDIYGGQVWIKNTTQPKNDVDFVAIPSFFKVGGGDTQIIRIMKVNDKLPKDKESIFWLNVQEIPSINKDEKNALVIAVDTQVKLIYRPTDIIKDRKNAESKMVISRNGSSYTLNNPTPYYFAVTELKINGKPVKLSKMLNNELGMIAPFSTISLNGIKLTPKSKILVEALDDYGATNTYEILCK